MQENKPNLNLSNTRTEEQTKRMQNAQERGLCPFCPEGLIEIHQKEIIHSNDSWLLTENAFPYEGTEHHFLIVSKKHISSLSELETRDWELQGEMIQYLIKEKNIDGGGIFLRFGNMKKNGSSVEHLHIHVISGDTDEGAPKENRESLRVKLGYKKI